MIPFYSVLILLSIVVYCEYNNKQLCVHSYAARLWLIHKVCPDLESSKEIRLSFDIKTNKIPEMTEMYVFSLSNGLWTLPCYPFLAALGFVAYFRESSYILEILTAGVIAGAVGRIQTVKNKRKYIFDMTQEYTKVLIELAHNKSTEEITTDGNIRK